MTHERHTDACLAHNETAWTCVCRKRGTPKPSPLAKCPTCQHDMLLVCMACRGKAGGSSTSPKKRRAVTRNLETARKAKERK